LCIGLRKGWRKDWRGGGCCSSSALQAGQVIDQRAALCCVRHANRHGRAGHALGRVEQEHVEFVARPHRATRAGLGQRRRIIEPGDTRRLAPDNAEQARASQLRHPGIDRVAAGAVVLEDGAASGHLGRSVGD
jgi:hypothetical protein